MTTFVILQLEKYSTTILSAMMAGMDDKDDLEDEITLESMSGLAKILAKLDENNVRQILINICLRIRPCFEKVGPKIKQCHSNGLIWSPFFFSLFFFFGGGVYFERFVGISFSGLAIETFSKARRRRQRSKKSNGQNNSSVRAFWNCTFLSGPLQITTWNHQNKRGLRKETTMANYLSFHLELNAALIRYAEVNLRRRKRW